MPTVTEMPYIGQPCTISIGSDAYPATVVFVNKTGKRIGIRQCLHTPAEGFNYISNQVYDYSENYKAEVELWSLRKDGKYRPMGSQGRSGYRLTLGVRRLYQDPSF